MKRKYCRIHLVSETIYREKWHYYGIHLTIFFSFDSTSIQLLLCILRSLFFSFCAHFSFSSPNLLSTQWKNNLTAFLGPIKSIYPSLKLVLAQWQWHSGKESTCNAGDPGSIPGLGRSPGKRNGTPLQYSSLENSRDRGAWRAIAPGAAKSQTWESYFFSLHKSFQ